MGQSFVGDIFVTGSVSAVQRVNAPQFGAAYEESTDAPTVPTTEWVDFDPSAVGLVRAQGSLAIQRSSTPKVWAKASIGSGDPTSWIAIGSGGGGTVVTSAPLQGDGSAGDPVTVNPADPIVATSAPVKGDGSTENPVTLDGTAAIVATSAPLEGNGSTGSPVTVNPAANLTVADMHATGTATIDDGLSVTAGGALIEDSGNAIALTGAGTGITGTLGVTGQVTISGGTNGLTAPGTLQGATATAKQVSTDNLVLRPSTTAFAPSSGKQTISAAADGGAPTLAILTGVSDTPAITLIDLGVAPVVGQILILYSASAEYSIDSGGTHSGTAYPFDDSFSAFTCFFFFGSDNLWHDVFSAMS